MATSSETAVPRSWVLVVGRHEIGTVAMPATSDLRNGIFAEVEASADDILAACQRAIEQFGDWAGVEYTDEAILVTLVTGSMGGRLVGSKKGKPLVVAIELEETGPSRLSLESSVVEYFMWQETVLGIPAGSKKLWGRDRYLKFLTALENELWALDPEGEIVRTYP